MQTTTIWELFIDHQQRNLKIHIKITHESGKNITMKIRKYFELNISENSVSRLVDDAKDLLGGKVRALNERRKIENQMIYVSRSQKKGRRTNLKKTE